VTQINSNTLAIIGECMLEISTSAGFGEDAQIPSVIGFGGDTLNTAIYMSRLGTAVNYVSALGDDRMSDWMIAQWQNEGGVAAI